MSTKTEINQDRDWLLFRLYRTDETRGLLGYGGAGGWGVGEGEGGL